MKPQKTTIFLKETEINNVYMKKIIFVCNGHVNINAVIQMPD